MTELITYTLHSPALFDYAGIYSLNAKFGCRCPCFPGAVEFFLQVRVQLLLQSKAHQSIWQSINQNKNI